MAFKCANCGGTTAIWETIESSKGKGTVLVCNQCRTPAPEITVPMPSAPVNPPVTVHVPIPAGDSNPEVEVLKEQSEKSEEEEREGEK